MQDHGRKDVEPMNKFDMMGKDALSKVEEIMNATKLNEFLHRKEEEEKNMYSLDSRYYRCCSGSRSDRVWCIQILHTGLSGRFRRRF